MTLWRTRFERINFGYDPVLYQMADVVFECDVSKEEYEAAKVSTEDFGAINKLSEAAWDAAWDQNSHWIDPTGPVKDGEDGWSSVLGGYAGSKYFIVNKATEDMADKIFPRRRSDD